MIIKLFLDFPRQRNQSESSDVKPSNDLFTNNVSLPLELAHVCSLSRFLSKVKETTHFGNCDLNIDADYCEIDKYKSIDRLKHCLLATN